MPKPPGISTFMPRACKSGLDEGQGAGQPCSGGEKGVPPPPPIPNPPSGAQPHLQDDEDVGEEDGGVQVVPPHRLHCAFGHVDGVVQHLQEILAAGLLVRVVLGEVAA